MEISIVVPVYNVENYLKACLDSLIFDSTIEYEIIVIDDGSTDNSGKIARDYAKKHSNLIKYFYQENGGLSAARNCGLEHACGKYIMFIDSDDYILQDKMKELWKLCIKKEQDIIFANYEKDIDGTIEKHMFNYQKKKMINHSINGKKFMIGVYDYFKDEFDSEAVTQIYNRNFLLKNKLKFTNGIIHEDTLFMIQILMKAKKVYLCDISFYRYRMRSDSIMNSLGEKHYISLSIIADTLYDLKQIEKINKIYMDSYLLSLVYEASKYPEILCRLDVEKYINSCKRLTIKACLKKVLLKLKLYNYSKA